MFKFFGIRLYDNITDLDTQVHFFKYCRGGVKSLEFIDENSTKNEEFYRFTIKDFIEKISVEKFLAIKEIVVPSLLINTEGIELFQHIENLRVTPERYDIREYGKDLVFFKVDLLWYPKLKELTLSRFENIVNLEKTTIQSLVIVGEYLTKTRLKNVKFPDTLTSLIISKNKDISFVKNIKNLERLSIWNAKHIDFSPLTELKQLKSLEIRSKYHLDTLQSSSLKELEIYNDGVLPSLKFVKKLPNLEDIRISSKTVEDGNLTPLIEHPNLKHIHLPFMKKCNYTLDEVLQIRTYGYIKNKTEKKTFQSLIDQININQLDEYYEIEDIEVASDEVSISLHFEKEQIDSSRFNQLKKCLKSLEEQYKKNLTYIKSNSRNKALKEYIDYHLSECKDEISDKSKKHELYLESIRFYPDNKNNQFAIWDYTLGLSNYLLVVYLNEKGELIEITTES